MGAHTDTDAGLLLLELLDCRRVGGRIQLWLPCGEAYLPVFVSSSRPCRDSAARDRLKVVLSVRMHRSGKLYPGAYPALRQVAVAVAGWGPQHGLTAREVMRDGNAFMPCADSRCFCLAAFAVRAETKLVGNREVPGYLVELREPFKATVFASWLAYWAGAESERVCGADEKVSRAAALSVAQ